MANLFSGLESLGLGKLKSMNIYEKEETVNDKKVESKKENQKVEVNESDLLFDKSYTCPVCDVEFKSKTVRAGKVKLMAADTDLRPKYQHMDSLKYDVVVCPKCGYATLNRFFQYVPPSQAKLIKENITASFKGLRESEVYTYDEAITRYKLALVNAIVKKAKLSEKAYTCLKTAWLLRGKAEHLPKETKDYELVINALKKEEDEFLANAYNGFIEAFSKERFPMCGMDEITTTYLVAELARRSGKYDEANRWISKVITSRDTNERIKEKARAIKEMIAADVKKLEEDNATNQ